VIAEDSVLLRAGLTTLLEASGIAVVAAVPDAETLSLNGPRPAWINRVIVRVTKNVTTKELKHSSSGTRCRSVISRWYQSCTARSYVTSPTEMPTFVSRRSPTFRRW